MTRNDLCWCGSGKKYKKCHMDFDERLRSMKFDIYRGQVRPPHSIIKNEADIEGIKKSGVVNDGALSQECLHFDQRCRLPWHTVEEDDLEGRRYRER